MKGTSLYTRNFIAANLTLISSFICVENSLDPKYIAGNILFCKENLDVSVETRVHVANTAIAIVSIITYDDAVDLSPNIYSMVVGFVHVNQSEAIVDNLNTTTTLIASLKFHIIEFDYSLTPMLGSFSSVGPNIML